MKRITVILLLLPMLLSAQGPADWWFFGQNAGLHFTSSGPVALGEGQMQTLEGNSSISTYGGDLLFYSDGSNVWDSTHTLMPNGTGLIGDQSSTHSGIIFPAPNDPTSYYLITVDAGGTLGQGLHYSKVDMTLNGGNGDVVVTEKNIFLADSTSEKIAGASKTGGFWAIAHHEDTDRFYSYEITAAGFNTTPVISNTGWATDGYGYSIKASPSGTKIAAVYFGSDSIFMYDFDLVTGEVSPAYKIGSTMSFSAMYGLEFSPNEERLYLQSHSSADVRQFDLTLGSSSAISTSEVVVGSSTQGGGGALQLGPDKKIYCARNQQSYLSVINDPNELGFACNWQDTGIVLSPGTESRWGLTAFIPTFFLDGLLGYDHCYGDSVQFSVDTASVDSIYWDFGDPSTGALNNSFLYTPKHLYSDTGSFTVTIIARSAIDSTIDTVSTEIYVYPRQTLDLGPDTTLCTPLNYVLDASEPFSSYLWNDSSTADTLIVNQDSVVWVTLFGVCDTLQDTVEVSFDDSVKFDLGPDTTFCEGQTYVLDADLKVNADVYWNTGDSTDSIVVYKSGLYQMNAINACGPVLDTVRVSVIPIPPADSSLLPSDTINCFANSITLERPVNDSITYMWSDSTSSRRKEIDTTQTIWLAAYNQCGFSIDTMHLVFNPEIVTELGEDTTICDEDSIQLFGTDSLATYVWNTGDTTDTVWTIPGVDENYIVTIKLGLCERVESRRVFADDLACPSIDCDIEYANIFTPNGDGINDRFQLWSSCDIHRFDMAVYNRWGQLVNYSSNIVYGWDGYVNGEMAAEGTYYFVVEYKDLVVVDADRQLLRGSFTLQR